MTDTMTDDTCPDCEAGNLCGDAMTGESAELCGGITGVDAPIDKMTDLQKLQSFFINRGHSAVVNFETMDEITAYLVREHGIGHKAIKRILEKD